MVVAHPHIVPIEVKVEHGERTHADDPQTVRLAWGEGQRRVLVKAGKVMRVGRVAWRRGNVHEPRFRHRLSASRVIAVEEEVGCQEERHSALV